MEKIFDLAIHGRGAASITRILIAEKVPTPGFINFKRDGTFANLYAGAPEEKSYAWTIDVYKRQWVDKASKPAKCLAALVLILERFFSQN